MRKITICSAICILTLFSNAQIVINEGSYRNFTQITDMYGKNPDWIELYNTGEEAINLNGYHLSDNPDQLNKWSFPPVSVPPRQWIVVFATGTNLVASGVQHWETAIRDNMVWKYINPDSNTASDWMSPSFNDSSWMEGQGGFGFSDDDDNTIFSSGFISVYTRRKFIIPDTSKIVAAILHVDFDDAFVAYLNGIEIARSNISAQASWNSTADSPREALMYQGQNPDKFTLDIDQIKQIWLQGENVLAVEAHNSSYESSDMSLRVFLSFGILDETNFFESVPEWFTDLADNEIHTNFKISTSGETIYLSNPENQIIDQLAIPPDLPINYSFGSVADGSRTRGFFIVSTPNTSNASQTSYTNGFEPMPEFSHIGGVYTESFFLSLSGNSATAQIRYTTDGQTPDEYSNLYTNPIEIASNMVVKASCFGSTDKLPSPVLTYTYFVGQQPTPAGILSVTMDNVHLYGESGIYDNWWTDWKRPCYIEYFEPDSHQPVFRQKSGIKIDGGAGGSRSHPQHSFRIEPGNSSLGDGDIKYPLIPSRPNRNSYAKFYIRNGSNQYLFYPCKDAIETKCMGDETKNTYSAYTPVQVYLNGQYWGYYELREKLDADYFKQNYGTIEDSLEILSVSYWYGGVLRAVTGSDPITRFNLDYQHFLELNAQEENFYTETDKLFDLDYYTDYICAQSWIGNTDWPYNNIRIHRSPQTNYKWQFNLIDLEWSLNPNGWQNSEFDHIGFMLYYDSSYPYIHLWQKAMENKKFHDNFINRFADLMNTSWKTMRLHKIANEIYTQTRPELPSTFERWGDSSIPVESYMDQFDQAHQTMLNELAQRSDFVRQHIVYHFNLPQTVEINLRVEPAGAGSIRINTVKPENYPWTGIYFDGVPVKIEAFAKPGYVFENWDANALVNNLNNPVFFDTLTQSVSFTAHFSVSENSDQIAISEINYFSEPSLDSDDWIEFWNYNASLPANISGWFFTDNNQQHVFTFPENTILPPNGRLVVSKNISKFQKFHSEIYPLGGLNFGLDNHSDAIKLYDHNQNLKAGLNYFSAYPWPGGAEGKGQTLELKNPYNGQNDAFNWFCGCLGGSPGFAFNPCNDSIVFSEINYLSDTAFNHGDWIELKNWSSVPIALSNWIFAAKSGFYTIPEETILPPQAYLIFMQDSVKFNSLHPQIQNTNGPFLFDLDNHEEWLRFYDKNQNLKLSVLIGNNSSWPLLANGYGYTLELLDSAGPMNNGANWFTGCYGGSPGTNYSLPCPLSVMEKLFTHEVSISPNPFSHTIQIKSNQIIEKIKLYNSNGQLVYSSSLNSSHCSIASGHFRSGLYVCTFNFKDGSVLNQRLIKQ